MKPGKAGSVLDINPAKHPRRHACSTHQLHARADKYPRERYGEQWTRDTQFRPSERIFDVRQIPWMTCRDRPPSRASQTRSRGPSGRPESSVLGGGGRAIAMTVVRALGERDREREREGDGRKFEAYLAAAFPVGCFNTPDR